LIGLEGLPTDYTDYTDFFGGSIPAVKDISNRKAHPSVIYLSEQNIHEATFPNDHSALKDLYPLKIICVFCVICGKKLQRPDHRLREAIVPSIDDAIDPFQSMKSADNK
jgi:hypothetical protein